MRTIIISILLIVGFNSIHAQSYNLSELTGKHWRFRAEDDRIYSVFSDSLWTTYIGHDNPDLSVKYYLSETADSIYLADWVGREKTGSYIVTCEQLHDEGEIKTQLVVYKIMALTPTLLLLRSGDKTYDFYNLPDEEVPTKAKSRPDIR